MNSIKKISVDRLDQLDAAKKWDVCFVGNACDERGKAITEYIAPRCEKIISVIYEPSAGGTLLMDGKPSSFRHIGMAVTNLKTVLVEATTLGVTEILYLLKRLFEIDDIELELIYLEPYEYGENKGNRNLLNSREFSLGNNNQYTGVKKFSCDLQLYSTGDAVFLLGFEGARLAQALEQNSLQGWRKHAMFGVPSFEAGWEMNAFANNINHIASEKFSIRFAGASNILDTLMQLEEIHKAKNNDDPTIIIPIGTKPMSIAAAIFLCMESRCQDSGILFDHPVKNNQRSSEIRCCHLYSGFKVANKSISNVS